MDAPDSSWSLTNTCMAYMGAGKFCIAKTFCIDDKDTGRFVDDETVLIGAWRWFERMEEMMHLVVFGPGRASGLASRRQSGAPTAAARSSVPARSILARAVLQILGFGGGHVRSCLRRQSLGTMAVSAVGQAAVVCIPPSSLVRDPE
jgi:hypothetical protein